MTGNTFLGFVGTLPFLVLGVGIDDMFIMVDGEYYIYLVIQRTPHINIDKFTFPLVKLL